jgi:serine/threonine-protein kinase
LADELFVPAAGALIAGRYQLRRVIGSGGMGQVWEAYDLQLESGCAIKFILEHMARDASVRSRFAREAKAVAALRSPHAVQILGIGEHGDSLYIAMELLEGETLRARLSRADRLDEATTLAILQQVSHALEKARMAGIVHRDLKPENIWLWSGHDVFAKILDFGVAKSLLPGNSLQTATGALLGTPYYMSPEQARGNHDVDHRSDLWSLAIIAVECLGGRRPYQSDGLGDLLVKILTTPPPPLSELAPHLPPALCAWWEKALARRPEQRFQTAAELVESLRSSLDTTGARPRPWSSYEANEARPTIALPLIAGSVSPVTGASPQRPQRLRLGLALAALAVVLGSVTLWRLAARDEVAVTTPADVKAGAALPAAAESPQRQPQRSEAIVVRPIVEAEPKNRPSAEASSIEDADLFVREARVRASEGQAKPASTTVRRALPARPAPVVRAPAASPVRSASPKLEPKPQASKPPPAEAPPAKPAAPANDYGF